MHFRSRKTHYPRTYFLLKKDNNYYLLFWLEYGKDNSIYLWFDDSPNNNWKVATTYHQSGNIKGKTNIALEANRYDIFDPHLSWHASGSIHVSGYDRDGKKGKHLISDKKTQSLTEIKIGKTIPFCQLVFPTFNAKTALKLFDTEIQEITDKCCIATLDKYNFQVRNENAPYESYLVIDNSFIPSRKLLTLDLCLYYKGFVSYPPYVPPEEMLYPQIISLIKEYSFVAVGVRFFPTNIECTPEEITSTTVACFNKESTDLFQIKKAC